jgi:TIR domain-containing protein
MTHGGYFCQLYEERPRRAFWIAKELETLGHTPHVHEWEIRAGENIYAWMEKHHAAADYVLCVVSEEYLKRRFRY